MPRTEPYVLREEQAWQELGRHVVTHTLVHRPVDVHYLRTGLRTAAEIEIVLTTGFRAFVNRATRLHRHRQGLLPL